MRFRLLGPIEVERDPVAVAIGGPQQRRLLAVLLAGARPGGEHRADGRRVVVGRDGAAGRQALDDVVRLAFAGGARRAAIVT